MNVDTPTQKGFVLPGMKRFLPNAARNHFIAMSGEFTGTFLFLLFALGGTQVVNANPSAASGNTLNADPAKLLYISLCFGMSLMVNAWVFFRISGGLFNPAVTLGMCLVGAVPYLRGGLIFISQILGAIAAAAVVDALTPGPLLVRTALAGGTSVVQGLFIEMFLTAQLVFAIFMLAAEKHKGTFIAPVGIGLSLFIAELLGVYYTGGSVNPARSFGPCVVVHNFYHYHWIYWVGPILGSLLASGFYMFMKVLEYETANPAQDADDEHFDPESRQNEKPSVSFEPESYANNNRESTMTGSTTNMNGSGSRMMGRSQDDLGNTVHPDVTAPRGPAQGDGRGYNAGPAEDTRPEFMTSPRNVNYNGGPGYHQGQGYTGGYNAGPQMEMGSDRRY